MMVIVHIVSSEGYSGNVVSKTGNGEIFSHFWFVVIYVARILLLEERWVFMGKCMRDIYELKVKRLRGCLV